MDVLQFPQRTRRSGMMMLSAAALAFSLVGLSSTTAHAATIAVWVGSPVQGNWPIDPSSQPASHHKYWGDWSVDLINVGAGQAVYLYAAPQDGRSSVSAQVEAVRPACASGRISDGGYRVTVGLYNGSTKVGTATYAHINPSVTEGSWINRWESRLGVVGSYNLSSCWQGVHLHYEMYSQQNYACYNRGWRSGTAVYRTNFLGFIGGSYAFGPRSACP